MKTPHLSFRSPIERAKKDSAKAISLYTSEAMTVARKMYTSLDFQEVRELPSMLGLRYWLYVLPIVST